jgi:hypothetical protein
MILANWRKECMERTYATFRSELFHARKAHEGFVHVHTAFWFRENTSHSIKRSSLAPVLSTIPLECG